MLEDINKVKEMIEEVKKERRETGLKALWVSKKTIDDLRLMCEVFEEAHRMKIGMPTMLAVLVKDGISANGLLDKDELDEAIEEKR